MRQILKSCAAAFILLCFTSFSAHALENKPGGIEWKTSTEVLALAASSGKKIYINFHAEWFPYCTKMAHATFKSESVIAFLNENFVAVQVDTDKEKEVARTYKVRGLPASFFLEKDSTQIGNQPGYLDADQFLKMLQFIIDEGYKK